MNASGGKALDSLRRKNMLNAALASKSFSKRHLSEKSRFILVASMNWMSNCSLTSIGEAKRFRGDDEVIAAADDDKPVGADNSGKWILVGVNAGMVGAAELEAVALSMISLYFTVCAFWGKKQIITFEKIESETKLADKLVKYNMSLMITQPPFCGTSKNVRRKLLVGEVVLYVSMNKPLTTT